MSRNKRLIIWSAVVACIFVSVLFVRSQYVVPILMYHSVKPHDPGENRLVVPTGVFDRQMAFLAGNKYKILTLEQAADVVKSGGRPSGKSVVVTFDDGNEDNYTHAFPILKKYGIRATIFLIANDIGKPDRLNMDQIREMQDSGLVTFGSHTFSHLFLDAVTDPETITEEIAGSKKALESLIGRPVTSFSYPMGRITPAARQAVVDAGYSVAVVTNPGKRIRNDDPFALKRLRISENAGDMFVFWAEISGYYNFLREHRHK